jgi:hypothetical protein
MNLLYSPKFAHFENILEDNKKILQKNDHIGRWVGQ